MTQTMRKTTIGHLIALLRPGYVAMDGDGTWYWYENKPVAHPVQASWRPKADGDNFQCLSTAFNIAPHDNEWEQSLIRIDKR